MDGLNAAAGGARASPIGAPINRWTARRAAAGSRCSLSRYAIIRIMFGLSGRQLFFLLAFIALLFAATQYGPAYFAAYQFNDFIRQEVKFAVTAKKDINAVRADILREAGELGISLEKNDIHMTRQGPAFSVEFEYHWPINLRVYKYELVFHVLESGEIFENAPN